jgi:hypothetical protein
MNAIDIQVSESINGLCVSLHASWSPAALCSALGESAAECEGETLECLRARLSEAMQRALHQAREEADRNLLKAYSEVLRIKILESLDGVGEAAA